MITSPFMITVGNANGLFIVNVLAFQLYDSFWSGQPLGNSCNRRCLINGIGDLEFHRWTSTINHQNVPSRWVITNEHFWRQQHFVIFVRTRRTREISLTKLVFSFLQIGSLSWSVLPGKVMFRDVLYMTPDFTVRVQDGFLIFRWWRSYVPKDVSEDLSHSDTRVSLQLNGFELHIYNRTSTYKELEKKFGIFTGSMFNVEDTDDETDNINKEAASKDSGTESSSNYLLGKNWRDLIPVVKVRTSMQFYVLRRILMGN